MSHASASMKKTTSAAQNLPEGPRGRRRIVVFGSLACRNAHIPWDSVPAWVPLLCRERECHMARSPEDVLADTLGRVAPGTGLRDGLERILRGRTGALIVLGFDRTVESICSGGFEIGI